jgi:hypothetical protein
MVGTKDKNWSRELTDGDDVCTSTKGPGLVDRTLRAYLSLVAYCV